MNLMEEGLYLNSTRTLEYSRSETIGPYARVGFLMHLVANLIFLGVSLSFACGSDAGQGLDAGPLVECEFPGPQVAGTTATDSLAQSPARCGQADHEWLRDPMLGEVTQVGDEQLYSAALLSTLAGIEGFVLPEPLTHDVVVRQILYTTQDRGVLVEASTLVAYPAEVPADREAFELLLLLHGTAGFNDECSPSNDTGQVIFAAVFASLGFVVAAPDYLGLKGAGDATGFVHPYLVGQPTAIASLDAARAAARLTREERGGGCVKPQFVTFGGSQGGHAALWVDRLAPYYAPELSLAGVVATVPPADLVGQSERALRDIVDATGNIIALMGTAPFWYGHNVPLSEIFVAPYDVSVPNALATSCDPLDEVPPPDTLPELFQPALLEAAEAGTLADVAPWGCIVAENGLTTTSVARIPTPDASYGILFVQGEADPLVNPEIERAAFTELCAQGVPLQYLECASAPHVEATLWSVAEIVTFIRARFAGEPMDEALLCELSVAVRCSGTPDEI